MASCSASSSEVRFALMARTFSLSSTRHAGSGGDDDSTDGATRALRGNSSNLESVDARPRLDVERWQRGQRADLPGNSCPQPVHFMLKSTSMIGGILVIRAR